MSKEKEISYMGTKEASKLWVFLLTPSPAGAAKEKSMVQNRMRQAVLGGFQETQNAHKANAEIIFLKS